MCGLLYGMLSGVVVWVVELFFDWLLYGVGVWAFQWICFMGFCMDYCMFCCMEFFYGLLNGFSYGVVV